MVDDPVKTGVAPGEYPFPLIEGPEESRYLTWIRNHSNYMAVRGFLDYVRAIGVLVRGALVNFLIGLPYLLFAGIVVAGYHVFLEGVPSFFLTKIVVAVTLVWILAFPLLTPLFRVVRHRQSLETGSDSSVRQRDRYERSFGGLVLAILVTAAFESLPAFLPRFHAWVHEQGIGWPAVASSMALTLALFGVSDKVLSFLGGLARRAAMVVIGAVGLVVPLLVVLFVADFLVFSPVTWDSSVENNDSIFWVFSALPLFILMVAVVGLVRRAFSLGDVANVSLLLVVSVLLVVGNLFLIDVQEGELLDVEKALAEAVASWVPGTQDPVLARLVRDEAEAPGPDLVELLSDIAAARQRAGQEGIPPPAASGFAMGEHLAAAAHVYELPQVASLVEGARGRLEAEMDAGERESLERAGHLLTRRLDVLHPLLEERSTLQLVEHVLWLPPGEIEALTDDEEMPLALIQALVSGEHAWGLDMYMWADTIKGVRRAVATRGVYSPARYPGLHLTAEAIRVRAAAFWAKVIFVFMVALLIWYFCWLAVDVNLTSIHGLYRDRLASAFLIGADTRGDVDIEEDLDLLELSRHEAGSSAPYHLINVALNLQGSRDISIRDRKSDFFVFSKRFIGGRRTGYCRGETMERVFPQMSLAGAMAISAAAASPNMGRATSPGLVAVMTLLNVRLGYWVPNPGLLEERVGKKASGAGVPPGYTFPEVFREELIEVARRWEQTPAAAGRSLAEGRLEPTVENGLVGIGFSGGGIRSATLNLGISQALHRRGAFDQLDYMSTVSGGGYLGSSLSSLMRRRVRTVSEIRGRVEVEQSRDGEKVVRVIADPRRGESEGERREYRYASYAALAVEDGQRVRAGQRLVRMAETPEPPGSSFGQRFRWRVRPVALMREVMGRLDETHRWVNVSDGGHIENLAGIELLRRRCRYVIIGDGEADPEHRFNGLATLIRFARIDLGIEIDIDVDALRLDASGFSRRHSAVGRIHYPGESEPGYLLYLKSSVTGDEDEVIREYRHGHPTFPHQSTADQFFDEGQFEAYRSLGQHIGEQVLSHVPPSTEGTIPERLGYDDLARWFDRLHEVGRQETDQTL